MKHDLSRHALPMPVEIDEAGAEEAKAVVPCEGQDEVPRKSFASARLHHFCVRLKYRRSGGG